MEKETMRGACMLFTPPAYSTVKVAWDLLTVGTNLAFDPDRLAAFVETYKLTIVTGLPFPPPLDEIVNFDPSLWYDIWQFVVIEGAPYEDGCAFSNFDVDRSGLSRPSGT